MPGTSPGPPRWEQEDRVEDPRVSDRADDQQDAAEPHGPQDGAPSTRWQASVWEVQEEQGEGDREHSDQRHDPGPGGDGSPREIADPGSGVQADLRIGEPEQPDRDREPDGREEPADRVAGVAARDERAHRAVGRDRQPEQGHRDGVGRRGGEHQDHGAEPDRERAEPHAVGQPSGGRGLHAWHRGSRARGFQGGSPAHARARTSPSLGCWHPPDVVVAAGSYPARSARSVASG